MQKAMLFLFVFVLSGCDFIFIDHGNSLYELDLYTDLSGETFFIGEEVPIRWRAEKGSTVDILYTTDDSTLVPIVLGIENSGSYDVVMPEVVSSTVKLYVRVSGSKFPDVTEDYFTITSPRWYVDCDVAESGNGLSWDSAFKGFEEIWGRDGLAKEGSEVWVAEGTYTAPASENYSLIYLNTDVSLYGGFSRGDSWKDRNPAEKITILDGTGFSNVIESKSEEFDTTIDGFTITGGSIRGIYAYQNDSSYSSINYDSTLRISNCIISNNGSSNSDYGTGIYAIGRVVIDNSIITNNTSEGDGGGLHARTGEIVVNNTTFSNNTASGGGAIHCYTYASIEVNNCTFENNNSGNPGGAIEAIYDSEGLIVRGSTFTGNHTGLQGGAIYSGYNVDNVRIEDCDFINNSAGSLTGIGTEGGAVVISGENSMIVGCNFINNYTAYFGGALTLYNSGKIINCGFYNNGTETSIGGAFSSNLYGNDEASSGKVYDFINCIFSGNNASIGGALYIVDKVVNLTNCVFTGNNTEGDYSAIRLYNSSEMHLNNSVIWNNTQTAGAYQIGADDSTVEISRSVIESGTSTIELAGNSTLTNNSILDTDPLFVDADGIDNIAGTEDDNLNVAAGSPCIDAGDNSLLTSDTADLDEDGDTTELIPFDIFGNQRIQDDPATEDTGNGTAPIVDIGAAEY